MRIYSAVSIDNGYTNNYQGMRKSTMDLYECGKGQAGIEWDIPSMDTGAGIGIWYDSGKRVTDYDGVFELNHFAVLLLESNGYDCSEVIVD